MVPPQAHYGVMRKIFTGFKTMFGNPIGVQTIRSRVCCQRKYIMR